MPPPNVAGLIEDIKDAFFLPIATLVLGHALIWSRSKTPWDTLLRKLCISAALGFFVISLALPMYQDRATLAALWRQDPTGYSFVYAGACILFTGAIAAVYRWQLRPALWRPSEQERELREEYARALAAKRRLFRLDGALRPMKTTPNRADGPVAAPGRHGVKPGAMEPWGGQPGVNGLPRPAPSPKSTPLSQQRHNSVTFESLGEPILVQSLTGW